MMNLFESIPYYNYHLADYKQLAETIERLIKEQNLIEIKEIGYQKRLTESLTSLTKTAIKPSVKQITKEIQQAQLSCTRAHSAFKHYLKAHLHHPEQSLAKAAKLLLYCIQDLAPYLGKAGRNKIIYQLMRLTRNIRKDKELQDAITLLNAESWLQAIEKAVKNIQEKLNSKTKTKASTFKQTGSEVALEIKEICNHIFDYVQVMHRTKAADYTEFINECNELIKEQKNGIARRKAHKKKSVIEENDWEGWE